MKDAFIKLHISIILAGATGIFGKLMMLNEALLVWYRMMLASLLFLLVLSVGKRLNRISFGDALRIGGVGLLLGLHWVFFYGSIKASNVSIGVVCFSLVGFFTAFLEPLINCHRVSFKEVVFSLLTLFGVVLIFHFDTRYRLGIGLGSISTMLMYEMVGGFIGLSCILPFYLRYFPVSTIVPGLLDFTYLLLLASVCTIGLYLLQIQVQKKISAFTVNLSYNLEPIYSIILAMLLFSEAKELNAAFYIGLGVIILSVILQTLSVIRSNKKI